MKKILLLGSGELGKELVISFQKMGQYVIAVDKYPNAPAMHVSHEFEVIDMLDGNELDRIVDKHNPDYIVPEIESIRTEKFYEYEKAGYNVVPSAKAANFTMNRKSIRDLASIDLNIKTATLEEKDHGLSEELLEKTDVLIWWGHKAHKLVEDRIVDRIQQRVLEGMGLLVLHSGHHSKIFKRMMGTTANIRWAERGEKERVWVCNPGHPIAEGLGEYFEIDMTEMYGEPFQVPAPDETVFVSWFEGGEVFRSGLCYKRGNGKIFYFRPGHESYPVYYNKDVQKVIKNSIHWVCPEKTSGLWIDRIAKGIDNMERKDPVQPIEVKGYQVDHNYKK